MSENGPSRNIGLDLVRVTETTALASGRWIGSGNRDAAHRAATQAMMNALNTLNMNGRIIIGEDRRVDDQISLATGQTVGRGSEPEVDVVVDPIDGTALLIKGRSGAISVVGVAPRGALWSPAPALYMDKIVVDREAGQVLAQECMDAPAAWTLALVARVKKKAVNDLTVIILDRPRNHDLIEEVRAVGASILLREEGDAEGALLAATPDSGVDLLLGSGGAAQGVIAACAVQALEGAMLARLAPQSDAEREAIRAAGLDEKQILTCSEMVRSDEIFFAATGITDSLLLPALRFHGTHAETHSLLIRSETGTPPIYSRRTCGQSIAPAMFDEFNAFEPEERRRSRVKIAFYLLIVLLLIVGLLWSALSSVAWLLERSRGQAETAASTPTLAPTPSIAPVAETSASAAPILALTINRIAFINAVGQVETIAPDGRDRRQISDESFRFQFPVWSPTGDYLAATGGIGVYRLVDAVETETRPLYTSHDQPPFYLYWSPDGRILSFLTNHPRGIGLRLVAVSGEQESRLLATGSPFYWAWTTDSAQLLIHTGFVGEEARLALLDAASGHGGPDLATPGLFQSPDISHNGRYWAYAELDQNGNSWLVAVDTQTGDAQRQRHAGLVAMSWDPTANRLAFISARDESLDFVGPLRLMDMATGEVSLLSRETALAFFWSPDGRYLAVITTDIEGDAVIADKNGRSDAPGKRAAQSTLSDLDLILVDTRSGDRRHLLNFEPTRSFIAQFLPFFDQYALSHRLWSPDSAAIVLPIRENRTNYVVVVPVSGGTVRQLAAGDMPFWSYQ